MQLSKEKNGRQRGVECGFIVYGEAISPDLQQPHGDGCCKRLHGAGGVTHASVTNGSLYMYARDCPAPEGDRGMDSCIRVGMELCRLRSRTTNCFLVLCCKGSSLTQNKDRIFVDGVLSTMCPRKNRDAKHSYS